MGEQAVNWFRSRREALDKTQREIAAALDVTVGTISNWERGESLPRNTQFDRVASVYGVAPEEIAIAVMELARATPVAESPAA